MRLNEVNLNIRNRNLFKISDEIAIGYIYPGRKLEKLVNEFENNKKICNYSGIT